MHMRPITPIPQAATPDEEGWLNLDRMAFEGAYRHSVALKRFTECGNLYSDT